MRNLLSALVIGILMPGVALPGWCDPVPGEAARPNEHSVMSPLQPPQSTRCERKNVTVMCRIQLFHGGHYRLETESKEMRMSHWLEVPLLRSDSGEVLLDLSDNIWHLESARETETGIVLSLARYPDAAKLYEVDLRLLRGEAILLGKTYPLAKLVEALNAIKP